MTVAESTLLGRPLWYEPMTTDRGAAEAFYKTVLGWTTTPFSGAAGQPYTLFNRSGLPLAGVMTRPEGLTSPPFWSMYVGVPKLEDAASHIKRLGGREHTPVIEISSIGRLQLMADPQGAVFYIYEPASAAQPPEAAPEVGDASWHELMTTDAQAAMTFYQDVFGWRPCQAIDMGPMGTYQEFERPHRGMIGGMMNKPADMATVPPNWQIYFRIADVHAAAEAVKTNLGQVLNGPMEVPGGDWIVNAMDPQGAAFGLHARR